MVAGGRAGANRLLRHLLGRPFSSVPAPSDFRPRKALVLSKVSRYEFEKRRLDHPEEDEGEDSAAKRSGGRKLAESEFRDALLRRGSNYDSMKRHHDVHKVIERRIVDALRSNGLEVRLIQRQAYDTRHVDWADVVFTAGGDGTFLLGASKVTSSGKPVVGINTDPTRSEGHLCIPKCYSAGDGVERAIWSILNGGFHWMFRRRLRISLTGDLRHVGAPAVELRNQKLKYPEYRYIDLLSEQSVSARDHPLLEGVASSSETPELCSRVLPVLALNEVFFGESLSSRVSLLEVRFDDDEGFIKTRNSGLCASTGTGSTSWTYNINKLTGQSVEALLRIVGEESGLPLDYRDVRLVDAVTSRFNDELLFDPEANQMAYTLRDPISMSESHFSAGGGRLLSSARRPRGKARRIEVKSSCFDACLVIDGSLSYRFNDGMRAVVEIKDEDALRTIDLDGR